MSFQNKLYEKYKLSLVTQCDTTISCFPARILIFYVFLGSNYDIENYFKNKSFKSPALGSFKKPASSPSSAAPPPKFPPAPRTTAINVAASTSTTGPRIFTINDLSNGQSASRSQSSPKKWIPLQGQGNIRHFVNNS